MKITNINLQAYQNINALKGLRNNAIKAPAAEKSSNKALEGASFADLLNRREIG